MRNRMDEMERTKHSQFATMDRLRKEHAESIATVDKLKSDLKSAEEELERAGFAAGGLTAVLYLVTRD